MEKLKLIVISVNAKKCSIIINLKKVHGLFLNENNIWVLIYYNSNTYLDSLSSKNNGC